MIITVLAVLIFTFGCLQQSTGHVAGQLTNQKNSSLQPIQKITPDLSKITATIQSSSFDLWLNGNGGPAVIDKQYVTVSNNNENPVEVSLACDDSENLYFIGCYVDPSATLIPSHTARQTEFTVFSSSGIVNGERKETTSGTYDIKITANLNNPDGSKQVIRSLPIKIVVNCAPGCCSSGTYVESNCAK